MVVLEVPVMVVVVAVVGVVPDVIVKSVAISLLLGLSHR
jgi:hypothetical protein